MFKVAHSSAEVYNAIPENMRIASFVDWIQLLIRKMKFVAKLNFTEVDILVLPSDNPSQFKICAHYKDDCELCITYECTFRGNNDIVVTWYITGSTMRPDMSIARTLFTPGEYYVVKQDGRFADNFEFPENTREGCTTSLSIKKRYAVQHIRNWLNLDDRIQCSISEGMELDKMYDCNIDITGTAKMSIHFVTI